MIEYLYDFLFTTSESLIDFVYVNPIVLETIIVISLRKLL